MKRIRNRETHLNILARWGCGVAIHCGLGSFMWHDEVAQRISVTWCSVTRCGVEVWLGILWSGPNAGVLNCGVSLGAVTWSVVYCDGVVGCT